MNWKDSSIRDIHRRPTAPEKFTNRVSVAAAAERSCTDLGDVTAAVGTLASIVSARFAVPSWWLLPAISGTLLLGLLLAALGCSGLLWAAPGCSSLLLAAPGCSWLLQAAAPGSQDLVAGIW